MTMKKTHATHAKHAPSSLGYKEVCPAFYGKSSSNAAADEGTLLHAALEHDDFTGLNDEQIQLVELCQGFRDLELSKLTAPTTYRELSLPIAGGLTYGTADFVAISGQAGLLMDWKFGRGSVEPAASNAQGAAYALGVFEMFPTLHTLDLHFVQPRREFISSHTYTRDDVPVLLLRIQTIIRRANARHKEEHPGLQCCYCRKQATCEALRKLALPIASRYAELTIPEELHPSNITDPRMMAHCLDCAKILKEWADSVSFHAVDMALNGTEIPGYKLCNRAGRKIIQDALAAYGAVKDDMSLEAFLSCCGAVKIEALTDQVSADAPRGQKQKTKDALIAKLVEEGIISQAASSQYLRRL